MQEKRSYKRIPILLDITYQLRGELHDEKAQIHDLTPTGMCLLIEEKLDLGQEVRIMLEITMPQTMLDPQGMPFITGPARPHNAILRGEVVRIDDHEEGYLVGLQLVKDFFQDHMSLLKEYLHHKAPDLY